MRTRLAAVLLVAAALLSLPLAARASLVAAPASAAALDPLLSAALLTAAPTAQLEAAAVLGAVPSAEVVAALRATGATVAPFEHLPAAAVLATPAQLEALTTVPGVRSLWLNTAVDEALDQSTAQLQATDVWAMARSAGEPTGYTGRGVGVATVDSGIDGTHSGVRFPEVTVQNVKPVGFKDFVWGAAVEDVAVTDVVSGHGSHVAGIIAGRGNASGHFRGVAHGASLVGLGASDGAEMLTILQSYDWIIENKDRYGIRVINNSWAHSDPQVPYMAGDPLTEASRVAVQEHGLVVVFAAGNAGQASGNVFNRYARNDWVISVGAVDKRGKLASFSSRGNDVHHPTVMAPGHFIASVRAAAGPISSANATPFDLTDPAAPRVLPVEDWPYYTVKSGTSMAAPHVSGVVALMLEANPALTPAQVKSILASTARPVAGCAVSDCGNGVVSALAAVRAGLQLGLPVNVGPVARLVASVTSGAAPLAVTLDASSSSDADGSVVSYRWDWEGDGQLDAETSSATVTHTFAAGAHSPSVVVVDDDGVASSAVAVDVRASNPPVASATAPSKARSGETVVFDASASSDPDGSIVTYEWNFGDGSPVVTTTGPTVTHVYVSRRATVIGWSVRVTDDAGVSAGAVASIRVTP